MVRRLPYPVSQSSAQRVLRAACQRQNRHRLVSLQLGQTQELGKPPSWKAVDGKHIDESALVEGIVPISLYMNGARVESQTFAKIWLYSHVVEGALRNRSKSPICRGNSSTKRSKSFRSIQTSTSSSQGMKPSWRASPRSVPACEEACDTVLPAPSIDSLEDGDSIDLSSSRSVIALMLLHAHRIVGAGQQRNDNEGYPTTPLIVVSSDLKAMRDLLLSLSRDGSAQR